MRFTLAKSNVLHLLGLINVCFAAPQFGPPGVPGPWNCDASGIPNFGGHGFPSSWSGSFTFSGCPTGSSSAQHTPSSSPSPSTSTATATVSQGQEGLGSNSSGPSQSATPLPPAHNRSSLSGGVIAGIAIGSIIGVSFLALDAYLLSRRKRQKDENPINPFVAASRNARPLSQKDTSVSRGEEKREIPSQNLPRHFDAPPQRHHSPAITDDQLPYSPQVGNTGATPSSIDILQLFEDRAFEPHLLRLISQRMDPGPVQGQGHGASPEMAGDDGLPAYRPE